MSAKNDRIQALAAALAVQFPARNHTRSFMDHRMRQDADLLPGLFTVIANGVADYPYEHSDYDGGDGGARQTELGTLRLIITGQIKLPEGSDGAAVEAAELDMLADLEAFADAAIADAALVELRLTSAGQSAQLDVPYGWIHTEWLFPSLED